MTNEPHKAYVFQKAERKDKEVPNSERYIFGENKHHDCRYGKGTLITLVVI